VAVTDRGGILEEDLTTVEPHVLPLNFENRLSYCWLSALPLRARKSCWTRLKFGNRVQVMGKTAAQTAMLIAKPQLDNRS
jgi:hypothetical protein